MAKISDKFEAGVDNDLTLCINSVVETDEMLDIFDTFNMMGASHADYDNY